jgi:Caspase domain/Domain of unknown function (DUF4384)
MRRILVFILAVLFSIPSIAQEQRALIIGIDAYDPPEGVTISESSPRSEFHSLDGCKNDAIAMRDLIVTRFGFKKDNGTIHEIYNTDATRDNILKSMKELLEKSKSGDIAFIYYAGHGSTVRNSMSKEASKVDESMVPADTWKEGVHDIRDKELGKIFNAFIDKGVILTVIFDCCHSSNMSRGISEQPKLRFIPSPNYDAKDPSSPPDPATKKSSHFLMFSACQSYQNAQEAHDDEGNAHGAFTLALISAIKQLSVDASATDIFNDARAYMKCKGKPQEPSITGSADRRSGTLFGMGKGIIPNKVLVPVMDIKDKTITLQGGIVSGLSVGNELKKFDDPTITLKVTRMDGADKCIANVTSGDVTKIQAGSLFEVTNWVSASKSFLKIQIPSSDLSNAQVQAIGEICNKLKANNKVKWIYDLDIQDPTVSLYYKGGKWYANTQKGKVDVKTFTADGIAAQFPGSKLFINIPPTKELFDSFQNHLKSHANVQITENAADVDYALLGRMNNDNKLEYALYHFGSNVKDSLESMPVRTDYQVFTSKTVNEVVSSLSEYAYKLGKISVWFRLTNMAGSKDFPYYLEIRDEATNKRIEKAAVIGQNISIHIVKDKANKSTRVDPRYVYVFMIDHSGAMQLVYPLSDDGNDENHFPDKNKPDDFVINEPGSFTIKGPTGTDNYYIFTTTEPILTYSTCFNQPGVLTGDTRSVGGGLDDLLNMGNISTRGMNITTPNNWSIKRVSLKTAYKVVP